MKKVLAFLLFIATLTNANDIKESVFIGGDYGIVKIDPTQPSDNYAKIKLGFYFYDENIYLISNRLYLSAEKIFDDNNDNFVVAKLNLDWIWNQIPFVKPFIGVNGGYIYENSTTSAASIGMKTGILLYLGNHIELEMGGEVTHPEDQDKFPNNFKQFYGGMNISF